ncbi:MAG: hypothetical protein NW226_16495 [Microscillaceae bacterium]|nr:hypothetical protein [Microscillaceae bacterium]
MNKRFLFMCFAWALLSGSLHAQRLVFPDDPGAFITYTGDILKNTKRPESENAAEVFTAVWNGGSLNAAHKNTIIQISQKMVPKRATAATDYTDLSRAIAFAANEQKLDASTMTGFLDVTLKTVENFEIKDIRIYLDKMQAFMLRKTIHNNAYSRVYAPGSFQMIYVSELDEALQNEFAPTANADIAPTEQNLPKITGPIMRFNATDLILATSFDSTSIKSTKGVFHILSSKFIGKGGKFDWSALDLDPNQVNCEFDAYIFDVTKPIIHAEYATLNYTLLLSRPVKGDFEYVSKARKDIYQATYPKFTSYSNDVEINQFGQDLHYNGGFTLEGRKIYSRSKNTNQLSAISGIKNDETAFKVLSKDFNINDSIISAPHVSIALYMGGIDSLYHSDLQFKLLRNKSEIQLVRDRNTSAGQTPFINNHHQFYINADVVKYNLEKDSLDIYMLSGAQGLRPAIFESFDYFNKDRYNNMIGGYNFHPLKLFTRYAQKIGSTDFYIQEMSADYRRDEATLRNVASSLQSQAYLDYEPSTGKVHLTKRINQTDSADVFLSAVEKVERKTANQQDVSIYDTYDHDNFIIESFVSSGPNASLSRSNNELVIRGIEKFPISEALNLFIIPDSSSKSVTVYGGRNLFMKQGEITVGNFRFIGKNFFLLYNDFTLEMPEIDNILFAIKDTTSGEGGVHEYGKEISFKPGRVIINDPLNKSGRKKGNIAGTDQNYESYPKLSIEEGGEVYFFTDYRQNYSYDSTRAYFQIYQIDMDSLNTKVPIFPGKFVSNIFPEFEEDLIPMTHPDNTMGLRHTPPKAGYPLYPQNDLVKGAHMSFNRPLVMNKDGLFSGGEIKFLSTSLKAPEFIFMPDSVTSDNIDFTVTSANIKGAEFAEAAGKTAQLRWLATEDRMIITNKEEIIRLEDARNTLAPGAFEQRYKDKLFTLYGVANPMTLSGNLTVSSDGLRGEGNLIRKDFTLLSVSEEPFKFGQNRFTASNVEFRINSKDRDPFEFDKGFFYTDNKAVLHGNFVDVDFDLGAGKANVHPDEEFVDFASLALPYAEYRTSIKEAIWDLNKKSIAMSGDSTSFFVATIFGNEDFNEENLKFNADKALYDIQKLSMKVEGIPFINSADASIVPKDGIAVILKDAEMQELKEAKVLIDTLNRYHRLFDGNIQIKSRLDFEGDATYQFVNTQKDTFNVKFDKFELIEDELFKGRKKELKGGKVPKYTFAQGTVSDKDNFYITSRVLYKGQIKMYANRRNLSLDGFIKLDLSSTQSEFNEWIPYTSDKGDSVFLAIESKKVVDNQIITSGLHFVKGANDLYSTFLSPKQSDQDKDVFLTSGILDYNPSIDEFKIAPQSRRDGGYVGNQLIFDDQKASIYLEGTFNFMDEVNSKFLKSSGTGRLNTQEKTFNFDTFLAFDLPMDFKAVATMQPEISRILPPTTSIILDKNDPLTSKVAEIAGEKDFIKFQESIGVRPIPLSEISPELKKTLIFSKVDLVWSEEYKTLYSQGALRLLSVFDKIYNADVTGFIELKKNAAGDGFTIYLQVDPDVWYYFEMEQEVLSVLSSDQTFNEIVETKDVELAALDKKEAFINKFRAVYGAAELPKSEKKKEEEKELEKKKEAEEEEDDGF